MEFKGMLFFVVALTCIPSQGASYRIRHCNESKNNNNAEPITINAEDSDKSVPIDNTPSELAGDKKWSFYIPIDFESLKNLNATVQDAFKAAQSQLEKFTCLRFRSRDSEDTDFISFTKDKEECIAENIGKIKGKNIINLGDDCNDSGLILQEIMHVLGFEHEHQRPDRDNYITVLYENIISDPPEILLDFHPLKKILYNLSLPYDYNSITHFAGNYLSFNEMPTIIPNIPIVKFQDYYKRCLSELDKFKINFVYRCYEKYPEKFNPQNVKNTELKSPLNDISNNHI